MSKTNNQMNAYNHIPFMKSTYYNKKNKNKYNQIEKGMKNKFDKKLNNKNDNMFDTIISRKYSKDSSNISTSNEDNDKTPSPKKYNSNYNYYRGNASDFNIKYKTELCKFYEIKGFCQYGDNCAYAHGVENLRSKVTNTTAYRTRKCNQFFEKGYCPYGSRCQFMHQLKSNIVNNPYDRKMTYKKVLETISKLENVDNIKKLIGKPRLQIFKEIINNEEIEHTESTLLEDIKQLKSQYF